MNNVKDSVIILIGLALAIIGMVTVAAITNGVGADAETQKALSYAVIGLVGALGGTARNVATPNRDTLRDDERGYSLVDIAIFLLLLAVAIAILANTTDIFR